MPHPKKGESKSSYISRCIRQVMHEGEKDNKAAAGKCYGMWKTYGGAKKAMKKGKHIEVKD